MIGSPSASAAPDVGAAKPAISESSVDLPQPEGPTMATNSCGETLNDTADSASTSSPVRAETYVFERARASIFARVGVGALMTAATG